MSFREGDTLTRAQDARQCARHGVSRTPRRSRSRRGFSLSPWRFSWSTASFALFFLGRARCNGAKARLRSLASRAVPRARFTARAPKRKPANDAAAFALQASLETHLAYVMTGNAEADRVSQAGLSGLSKILTARTAVEPGDPMAHRSRSRRTGVFPADLLAGLAERRAFAGCRSRQIDAYMKQGGLIIFDTKNDDAIRAACCRRACPTPLSQLLGKLDLPPLQRVPDDHVLTKSFYLLQSFPGRWDNGDPWVEARSDAGDATKRAVKSDGVSSIIVTSNDLAAAWAMDDNDRPMFAAVPGGEDQREMSYRVGINIVMYALTGNYKADQVHVPAILERLGH